MATVEVTWIAEKRFVGVDSTSHAVVLSGGNDIGVKPSDTLLIALAACAAYDVVDIVKKQRARLDRMIVTASGEQAPDPPWSYQRIHLHFSVAASGLRSDQLERAVDLSLNKYCSVRASLNPDIALTFDVALREPGQVEG